jgi:hypothetical protein
MDVPLLLVVIAAMFIAIGAVVCEIDLFYFELVLLHTCFGS